RIQTTAHTSRVRAGKTARRSVEKRSRMQQMNCDRDEFTHYFGLDRKERRPGALPCPNADLCTGKTISD
ncbi:MAG: hypothetical protein WCY55_00005, partial [Anaerovoracaceae bacterium]